LLVQILHKLAKMRDLIGLIHLFQKTFRLEQAEKVELDPTFFGTEQNRTFSAPNGHLFEGTLI